MLEWTGVKVLEVGFTESGNGKNVTDCKIQKQKLALGEGLKSPGASATTAVECNKMVLESVGQSGTAGSLVSMSISMDRTSQPDANTVKSVKIKDISKMYHYEFKYDGDGVSMVGHTFDGFGCGVSYAPQDVKKMRRFNFDDLEVKLSAAVVEAATAAARESADRTVLRGAERKAFDCAESATKRQKKVHS